MAIDMPQMLGIVEKHAEPSFWSAGSPGARPESRFPGQ
jgi:hypothetical protein